MCENKPWHEQDAFWEAMRPLLFTESHWDEAPAQIEQALTLLNVLPGAKILDLCCGTGRHSLELARRGLQVTGVDRTALYLEEARKRAETEQLTIEFVQDDMRTFCRPGAFDGAINLYTSFGYFENAEDNRRVLTNVHCSLRDNGTFVIDMMSKEVVGTIFQERDWREVDGTVLLEERKLCRDGSWMNNRWTMLDGALRKEFHVTHRLYSEAEITSLLTECGFAAVDVCGDFSGAPYDHDADRLVVVAHKQ
jgi:SAM-dependent methyltransferase